MGSKAPRLQHARLRPVLFVVGVILLIGVAYVTLDFSAESHRATQDATTQEEQLSEQPEPTQPRVLPLRLLGKAMDPEVMQHSLPEGAAFLPEYKTPCWTGEGGALRCLPYVYIMGSFQSGSNTLFMKLSEHPDIVTNDVSRWQFWAEEAKSMSQYVDKHSSGQSLKQLQSDPAKKVLLDGSASTFAFYWAANLRTHRAFQGVMVPCWKECAEGSKGNKDKLRQCTADNCYNRSMAADTQLAAGLGVPYDELHLPALVAAAYGPQFRPKLIVTLRHPLDRVHCAYWQYAHYHNKYGKTAEGFLAYVKEQVGALKKCAQRFVGQVGGLGKVMDYPAAERHCALYFEALGNDEEQIFFHADQFMRGMYAVYLDVWLRHWPREQLLVVRADREYFVSEEQTLDKVVQFLNLTTPTSEQKNKMLKAGKPSPCIRNAPKMLPEAEKILLDLYRPYNEQLAQLLQDKQWLEYNQPPQPRPAQTTS